MSSEFINIGFGNVVSASKVIAIVNPTSAPIRRLKEDASQEKRLIDASEGRRTRAIIITESGHVILSAVQAETLTQRFRPDDKGSLPSERKRR